MLLGPPNLTGIDGPLVELLDVMRSRTWPDEDIRGPYMLAPRYAGPDDDSRAGQTSDEILVGQEIRLRLVPVTGPTALPDDPVRFYISGYLDDGARWDVAGEITLGLDRTGFAVVP